MLSSELNFLKQSSSSTPSGGDLTKSDLVESPDFIREEQARSKTPEAGSDGGGDKERATVVTSDGGVIIMQEEENRLIKMTHHSWIVS